MTLDQSQLFNQLKPDELATLRGIARAQSFAAGAEIFRESDPGDGVYLVQEGQVEISVVVGDHARHVFSQVGPGEIFGEMAVLEDKPRSASAVAAKPTVVFFIPRGELLKLVEGSPALALALLREISHRLREFNRQYLREVLQAERLAVVGRFARSIIHDLKNPLNIIGLTAEMAGLSHGTPDARQQAVESIRLQVERISEMISEILDFTQGPSTDVILPPFDYGEFIQHVLEEIRPNAEMKAVAIEFENQPPGESLLLNPKRLRRVFDNLVRNAVDAMPEGGKIILRFELRPNEVVTEFEDTGPGIPPEMAGQLFEPFASFGKLHGTGLGLSICKRVIEDHHGWMKARNEPGRGAIFVFGLPRQRR